MPTSFLSLTRPRFASLLLAASVAWLPLTALSETNGEAWVPEPQVVAPLPPLAGFQQRDFEWLDAARHRAVPVRLYLPDRASAAHPVPLVVFSHGIGGSRRGYSYLGQYWASQGYASLHLQHVGSDRAVWTGNPLGVFSRLQAATQESEAMARVQDLHFALDQLLGGELAPLIDAQRIVAAGHSYGANTTLLAVGARIERDGHELALRDPRLRAAIVISAPPFYGERAAERVLGAIAVPTLHITATEDVIRVPGHYSPASDRVAVFDATGGPDKTLAVFAGGSHSIFTDRAGTGGATLNPQVKRATQALSLAFLRRVFDGDGSALAQWPAAFGPLLARYSPVSDLVSGPR
ncbi:alpha/beta hydrolase family protein [Aquabacterium sp.]|uniref:alpha/beta hydrolase family protein n=1 Tax=Aquabacterium sp. TaxID=1872578 RepID=UPI003783FD4E